MNIGNMMLPPSTPNGGPSGRSWNTCEARTLEGEPWSKFMGAVLVVEDEPLIALSFGQIIEDATHEVVRLSSSLSEAERQLSGKVDFALLDVKLGVETSLTLARRLVSAGIPFAFVSSSNSSEIPDDLRSARLISKPCKASELIATVRSALERGHASG